ncbi:hypothetical protein K1719_005175 [Acacia pycnantha]|nr:hypothetical protein K1719_005175 [Acacia pycnantha]
MEAGQVERSKCQDCGNQAKKGCEYKRCRSCCNNKGFECETHVRSTWVPLYDRRRHRNHHHPHNFPKRHKHNNPYPPPDEKEELKFPEWVSMKAIFRCVQVRSKDDWVNELAYHTSVRIGGHVFCGLLHDQGPSHGGFGETSSVPLVLQNNNNLTNVATQTNHIDAVTLMAPPLSSSSAPDSIFQYPPYTFTTLPPMPYFSNPQS